ncbi:MAG: hypothetical protein ACOVP1_13940 [Bacteroidia bacterium]
MNKTYLIVSILILFGACISKKNTTINQVPAASEVKEEVSTPIIQETNPEFVYKQKCGACHKPYHPSDFTETDWKIIVPDMVNKANRNSTQIGPGQQELILKYVLMNAKK